MATSIECLIECTVCTTEFVNPRILPCQHTFCKECIDTLIVRRRMKCPMCTASFTEKDVKPDFNRVQFIEFLKSKIPDVNLNSDVKSSATCELCHKTPMSNMCEECEQFICADCRIIHHRSKVSRNHKVIPLDEKWGQIKPEYDAHTRILQARLNELDEQNREYVFFSKKLMEIEEKTLSESQCLRKMNLKQVDNKFDKIDEDIRAFIALELKQVEQVSAELNDKHMAIASRLGKLREDTENENTCLIVNKETVLRELLELQNIKNAKPPHSARIDIKQIVELNIDTALDVVFDGGEYVPVDLSKKLVSYKAATRYRDQSPSFEGSILVPESLGVELFFVNIKANNSKPILKLQQGFDSGIHLFKITVHGVGYVSADIGVVSNEMEAHGKDITEWTNSFEEACWATECDLDCEDCKMKRKITTYMMLILDGERRLEFKYQGDYEVCYSFYKGKIPQGLLYPAAILHEFERADIQYVDHLSVAKFPDRLSDLTENIFTRCSLILSRTYTPDAL